MTNLQLHLFSLKGDTITHLQRIEATATTGPIQRLFSPRFLPDGKRAIVLHDMGEGGKGTLDDVLIVDLSGDTAAVTERVSQIADGLENVAVHPSGDFAVVCCLEGGLDVTSVSHLAVIDLTTRPARVLSYTPIELIPEGMEFTADGSQLFVGSTTAQHIAVFDVDGFTLRRSPFVLRTGHGPAALAIGTRVSYFDSQGVNIAYTDAGHGEPIVMLHGAFNSLDGWLSNPSYTQLVDANYRVILMDCRGHGRSGKPHDVQSYGPEMADDVVRLLDHLKIPRVHVIGYSMGGDIANKLRERHPDRLITAVIGGVGRNPTDGWAAVDFDVIRLAESLERGEGAVEYLCLPLTVGQPAWSRREAEEANTWFMKGNDPLAVAAMVRGYANLSVATGNPENNTVPTLLLVGELDSAKPNADKLKEVMSNLEYVVIPGASHFTAFQSAEFKERILGFLRQHRSK
jgi:pimeloyl-ACP methyl ester carboxylesterase